MKFAILSGLPLNDNKNQHTCNEWRQKGAKIFPVTEFLSDYYKLEEKFGDQPNMVKCTFYAATILMEGVT